MAKKSRQRKSQLKRPPESPAGKTVPLAPASTKPWQIAAVCVILAVVTLFAYQGVRRNSFLIYDDDLYVLENPHVQNGLNLESAAWAFSSYYASNWHPITWMSHMVDWSLYGRSPVGPHITNVCLHAVNSILLFLLLLYMTASTWRSAIVAFLFALHPAHVESVAWIAERKDLLCAFFWFATLLAYAWYVRKPSWKRFSWAVCGFACALLSKPMAVTLPFTLLLLDYWPLRRITFSHEKRRLWLSSFWKLCLEKWPLFIMAYLSSIITSIAQLSGGSVVEFKFLSVSERFSNAVISYWRYVQILFWPDKLRAYYYYDFHQINVLAAVLSTIALILVTLVCWHLRNRRPYCLVGWLWFLGALVPVIGIMQVGVQSMAERYTYIPFIGLFIAIVWLAADAVANSPKIKLAAQLLAILIIVACAAKTYAQVKVWKDTVTLFNNVLAIDPRGEFPASILGSAYLRQGKLTEAEDYFERSLSYSPDWTVTLGYSAVCLMQTNDPRNLPLAKQRLDKLMSLAPADTDTLLGMAEWSNLMGDPKNGEMYSRRVLATHPDYVRVRLYLGDALQAQRKLPEAVDQYHQVIAMEPYNYIAHSNLGNTLEGEGFHREALEEFRRSLDIKPDQATPHAKIGRILELAHQYPAAAEELTKSLQYYPNDAHAQNDLGVALFQLGNYDQASEHFGEAVRIDPAYADARQNLNLTQVRLKFEKPQQAGK
jgi:tetratricopeptide (TPR) repeat protein